MSKLPLRIISLWLIISIGYLYGLNWLEWQLYDGFTWSGWLLTALYCLLFIFFLTRSKLESTSLFQGGRLYSLHLFISTFSLLVLASHIHYQLPTGYLEATLFSLITMIALTGLLGLYLNKHRFAITRRQEASTADDMPIYRKHLVKRCQQLIEGSSQTLCDFYNDEVIAYLNQFYHGPLTQSLPQLQRSYQCLALNDRQRDIGDQLMSILIEHHAIEQRYQQHQRLSGWRILHISLAVAIIGLIISHIIAVHVFL